MTQKILYGFIAIIIAGVLFFFRAELGAVISIITFWKKSFIDRAYTYKNFEKYLKENEVLKSQLEMLSNSGKEEKKSANFKKLSVNIFSNYPFNDHSIIVLNAGSENGLELGMPITDENNVILGKIVSVRRTQSVAQTIFDPDWKSTVSVGTKKVKALFKGGVTPQLDLIALDSLITERDAILNLSPELPFGYLIGFVENVGKSKDGSWIMSAVRPGINLETINNVSVLTDFP